ncbi:MAG: NAD-dependent epimerase/dehydratase family protein [Myxococcota bacterium]|nr:NAD-dependent epimerase/dehydratase family protein [Myxococcota bacterium]
MNVLVVGGTQFNGLALVQELARTGHRVTVVNRGQTQVTLPYGVERLYADRTQPESLRKALGRREWDAVYDISGYRPEDVSLMIEILADRTGHYIFASSTVIYAATQTLPITEGHAVERGQAQNEYGLNKLLCEDLLVEAWRKRSFPASIAALSMVFGPHNIVPDREQRMFIRLQKGRKVLIPGSGSTLGQVGYVKDQARALRMMMQKPATFGKRYNLTGGDYFSDEGYVDTLADVMGVGAQNVDRLSIPAEFMDRIYSGEVPLGAVDMTVHADTRTRQDTRKQSLFQINCIIQRLAPNIHPWDRSVLFSVERLKDDTGWRPEFTFQAAVEHTWDWMQSSGRSQSLDFDFAFEDQLIEQIAGRA